MRRSLYAVFFLVFSCATGNVSPPPAIEYVDHQRERCQEVEESYLSFLEHCRKGSGLSEIRRREVCRFIESFEENCEQ